MARTGWAPAPWSWPAWSRTTLVVASGHRAPSSGGRPRVASASGRDLRRPLPWRWHPRAGDDPEPDTPTTAHRTACGMLVPAVLAHRLPVQPRRLDARPLPQGRAAHRQRRSRGGRLSPITADAHGARFWDVHERAPAELRDGYGEQALPRAASMRPVEAVQPRPRRRCARPQPLVGAGAPRHGARHIGAHPWAMRIPLPEVHGPRLAASWAAPDGPVPPGHPVWPRAGPLLDGGIHGRELLAPKDRHHHAYRQQKAMAPGGPWPPRRYAHRPSPHRGEAGAAPRSDARSGARR